MARYVKDGHEPVETSNKAEGVQLRASGFREEPAKKAAPASEPAKSQDSSAPKK